MDADVLLLRVAKREKQLEGQPRLKKWEFFIERLLSFVSFCRSPVSAALLKTQKIKPVA
jgi:primosomal protein N''